MPMLSGIVNVVNEATGVVEVEGETLGEAGGATETLIAEEGGVLNDEYHDIQDLHRGGETPGSGTPSEDHLEHLIPMFRLAVAVVHELAGEQLPLNHVPLLLLVQNPNLDHHHVVAVVPPRGPVPQSLVAGQEHPKDVIIRTEVVEIEEGLRIVEFVEDQPVSPMNPGLVLQELPEDEQRLNLHHRHQDLAGLAVIVAPSLDLPPTHGLQAPSHADRGRSATERGVEQHLFQIVTEIVLVEVVTVANVG